MASNSFDDQTSDAEGWEIANGHQPSPEVDAKEKSRSNSLDVTSKGQELTKGDDVLHCPTCLSGCKFLKNLGCRCNACANCAEKMLLQWRDGNDGRGEEGSYQRTRLCTTCDQEHAVPSLVHTALKPVFGPKALKCMSCQSRKDTQDGWWCQDCSAILCSKCAHKSHRDHATVEFDQEYDAVRFCFCMFQTESQETATRFKTMTWAKFEEIFKVIEAAIDHELESQNKLRRARLTDIFGHCAPSQYPGESGCGIHRRLSIIQQRAKQQFPSVLDEILSLAGVGTQESVDLKTVVVAEKIVHLLKSAINELSAGDFKLTPQQPVAVEETEPETNSAPTMYIGECAPNANTSPSNAEATEDTEATNRHY